jgi:RND family efflux transporter MFP subunit
MSMSRVALLVPLTLAAVVGCREEQQPQMPPPPPPEVLYTLPVAKEVTDYELFTGHTEAIKTVDIRARVTGYLDSVNFKDGAEVQKNDLLAEIDPRPYKAELARAEANRVQAEAHLKRLNLDLQRAMTLMARGAIGREEFDKISGDRAEASAMVGVAVAGRDSAQLNLDFTQVRAPLTGRISRRNVDPGNLVKADDTILTTIVSQDPMYAYFDVDERTILRLRRLFREGQLQATQEGAVPVMLSLADEDNFSMKGTIDFVDNKVDPNTGTLWLRGVFTNPKRLLTPGLFVRIRLPVGKPHQAILIPEQALGRDQGQKFVYVVNDKDEVVYRHITVGRQHEGLQVITDGIKPGDKVVVGGLQRIRPDIKKYKPKPADQVAKAPSEPRPG